MAIAECDSARLSAPTGALEQAGTHVCEPMTAVRLELPLAALGGVLAALGRLGEPIAPPATSGSLSTIDAIVPARVVDDLRCALPGLTAGEGVLETHFAGYQPVTGPPPTRPRTTPNPLNRGEYMLHVARRLDP